MAKIKYRIIVEGVKEGLSLTNYTNEEFGIYDGTWTIESYGDLVLEIRNATQKINVSKGGGLASGYTFSFSVTNISFFEIIEGDGVFFNNLYVQLQADTGSGYNTEWYGVIESFNYATSSTINFKCTDYGKARNEKVSSEIVPICLNRNYNCKVPEQGFVEETFKFDTSIYGYITKPNARVNDTTYEDVDSRLNFIVLGLPSGSGWATAIETLKGVVFEVVAGNGVGTYHILGYVKGKTVSGITYYQLTLDKDVSDLIGSDAKSNTNLSVAKLSQYTSNRNISKNNCFNVHNNDGTYKKGLKINDDGKELPLYNPLNYVSIGNVMAINGLAKDKTINSFESIDTGATLSVHYDSYENITQPRVYEATLLSVITNDKLKAISNSENDDSYLIIQTLNFNGIISAGSDVTEIYVDRFNVKFEGLYKNEIVGSNLQGSKASLIESVNPDILFSGSISGSDLRFTPLLSGEEYKVNDFSKNDVFAVGILTIDVRLETVPGATVQFSNSTSFTNDPVEFRSYDNYDLKNLSIGTNGENVTASDNDGQFASVTDTIQYLQETYGNIATANINTASYATAESDYEKFPSAYQRNAAHQINESTDMNTILKNILYDYNLAMFFGRNGQYYIRNFMVESYQFQNNITPTVSFGTLNTIKISKLTKDDLNNIVSDYELKWNYNEATGEHENLIRIKNPNEATFDFSRDTEGVSHTNEIIAKEAWNYLKGGYNRSKKLSQTKQESKWIKTWFPESGDGEAINFIRNQVQWTAKQHEYITVTIPVTATTLAYELLTFCYVNDGLILETQRQGWIVKRVLNPSNDTIEITVLLDVSQRDPFLENVNIIQDDPTETDEIVDDPTETNEIVDGDGK